MGFHTLFSVFLLGLNYFFFIQIIEGVVIFQGGASLTNQHLKG